MDRKMSDVWRPSRYNLFAPIPGSSRYAGINLVSGCCKSFTRTELCLLSETEFFSQDHPAIKYFRKLGMVVNYDELKAMETIASLASAGRSRTVCLTICPTMGCNFDCSYCYEPHGKGCMSETVQDDVIALADRMMKHSRAENLIVRWFGGEPLLYPGIIEKLSKRLMELAERYGASYKAWIFTNGYLLTQDVAELLGRCGVYRAHITLDGLQKTHDATRHLKGGGGTFEQIVRNLSHKLPFDVTVHCTLRKENTEEKEAFRHFLEQLGEESGNRLTPLFMPVMEEVKHEERSGGFEPLTREQKTELLLERRAERFGPFFGVTCEANNLWNVEIDADGRLFRCWSRVDQKKYSFGTASEWDPSDPVRTADRTDALNLFLNAFQDSPEECKACVWHPLCNSHCPMRRFLGISGCLPWKDDPETFVLAVYRKKYPQETVKESGETDAGA